MEKIAFISGETFVYWNGLLLTLAVVAAIATYAALYLHKGGDVLALSSSVLLSLVLGIPLARLIHWCFRADSYAGFLAAMTDYSSGDYALMGAFLGCLLSATLLRKAGVCKNLLQMLDCMAIGGGTGIAVGRLASMFNASDRGEILPAHIGLPFAYPVTNVVSGAADNRLATFMLQSILTGGIVLVLLIYMLCCRIRKKKLPDGDICLLFLLAYGAAQIVCDSTRYDSMSLGFVSMVQIMALVALVVPIVWFSVRTVQNRGLKPGVFVLWGGILAAMGLAGYMEYYVQRHGSEAAFAYSVMSVCLAVIVTLSLWIRGLGFRKKPVAE